MYYKQDWQDSREWLTGWWRREVHGHWALGVTAPRHTPLPPVPAPAPPADHRTRWLDAAGNLARSRNTMATTFYGGCAFPYVTACLGPGSMDVFLGCEPEFMPETIWYKPCVRDPGKGNLRLDPANPYWRWTLQTTRDYVKATAGQCLTAVPDLIEGLDVLSEVLGTEELLTYLIDRPAEIHRLLAEVNRAYFEVFDALFNIVKDDRGGNAFIAFNAWGPGKTLKSQCDFSAMISPDMFAEFVCPYLEQQCAWADFSTYHLDGPGAIRHLDHLLQVRSLKALQWTPGYPNPHSADRVWWDKVWRKVYAAGKSAMVLGNSPDLVEPFLREFGQKGTFLTTGCETETEARRLIDASAPWGA